MRTLAISLSVLTASLPAFCQSTISIFGTVDLNITRARAGAFFGRRSTLSLSKTWSEMLAMAGGPVRTPLLQMPSEQRERMRADLDKQVLLAQLPLAA